MFKNSIVTSIVILVFASFCQAQSAVVSITIVNKVNGIPLPEVYVNANDKIYQTNQFGVVRVVLSNLGNVSVWCDLPSFSLAQTSFLVQSDTSFTIALIPRNVLLLEAEVFGDNIADAGDVVKNKVLVTKIERKDMNAATAILGEQDPLKPLSLLPGVQAGSPGGAGIYVRGGDMYHNAMFVDGAPIFAINHGYGYVSPFAPGGVEGVYFSKQAFDSKYGGVLSSLMDVTLTKASTQKTTGRFSGGFGALNASVGIPLLKDKMGVQLTARYSTIGMANLYYNVTDKPRPGLFGFDDYSLKWHYNVSNTKRLEITGYVSRDKLTQSQKEAFNYLGEITTTAPMISAKYIAQTGKFNQQHQVYYSAYKHIFSTEFKEDEFTFSFPNANDIIGYQYFTDLQQMAYQNDFSATFINGTFTFGSALTYYYQNEPQIETTTAQQITLTSPQVNSILLPSIFGQMSYHFSEKASMGIGLRLSYFSQQSDDQFIAEPSLNYVYEFNSNYAFFAAADKKSNIVHRFRNNTFGSASDIPILANDDLPYSTMHQYALGVVYVKQPFEISVSPFYRVFTNLIDRNYAFPLNIYSDVGVGFPNSNLRQALFPVDGTAAGVESAVGFTKDIYNVKATYTYSNALRQANNVNFGDTYPFEFNRKHSVSFNGTVRFKRNSLNKITEISALYEYGTGNFTQFPVQAQLSAVNTSNSTAFVPFRNNAQLPAIQHFDIGVNFIKQKKRGVRTFTISVFNLFATPIITAYNRVEVNANPNEAPTKIKATGPIRILPSFSYAYEF